ncbi:MAG: hypothetical protein KKA97_03165 [Actinobacteria bacterium]|nr:hypothetical protein [Actinomycetota bacterium]
MDPLTEVLGAEPPTTVRALAEETRSALASQVHEARRVTAALNAEAVETALRGVPLPVRGLVRKTLGA